MMKREYRVKNANRLLAVAGVILIASLLSFNAHAATWSFTWRQGGESGVHQFNSESSCKNALAQWKSTMRNLGESHSAGSCIPSGGASGTGGNTAANQLGQAFADLLIRQLSKAEKTPQQRALKEIKKAIRAQNKGDFLKEAEYYRQALRYVDAPIFHVALGIALVNAGDNDGALRECERIRRKGSDPEQVLVRAMALQCAGMALYRLKNYRAAEASLAGALADLFEKPSELGPEFEQLKLQALYFRGMNALKDGRYNNAIRYFRNALTIDPNDHKSAMGIVYAADESDQTEVLEDALKIAFKLRPDQASLPMRLARIASEQKRYAEAEDWYRAVLKLEPRNESNLKSLAVALSRQEKFEEEEKYAKRAFELNPKDDWNARIVGQAQYKQGKYKEAVRYLEKAVRLNPDEVFHKWLLADALAGDGKMNKAEEVYLAAMRQKPDLPGVQASYAYMLQDQGRNREAEQYLRSAVRLRPEAPGYHHALSEIYEADGRFDAALVEARRALVLDPKSENRRKLVADLEAKTEATPANVLGAAARADAENAAAAAAGPAVSVPAGPSALDQARAAAELRPDATKGEAAQIFDTQGSPADAVYVGDILPGLVRDAEYQRIQTRFGDLASIRDGLVGDLDQAGNDLATGKITRLEYDAKIGAAEQDIDNLDGIVAREKLKEQERVRYYEALTGSADATSVDSADPNGATPEGLGDDAEYRRIETRLGDLASLRDGLTADREEIDRKFRAGEINDAEWQAGSDAIEQDLGNIDGIIAREKLKAAERREFYDGLKR